MLPLAQSTTQTIPAIDEMVPIMSKLFDIIELMTLQATMPTSRNQSNGPSRCFFAIVEAV